MTISTEWVHMFQRHRDAFHSRAPAEQSTWLSLGTYEFEAAPEQIRRYGFTDEDEHRHLIEGGMRDVRLHKELCAALFRDLGYGHYMELDINNRAEIVWDMNLPIPEEYHEQYSSVYDGGTLEHTLNPYQGVINMLRMTKIGGIIAHSQGVGDQINHGYWTFNPSFLADFYQANGCVLRKLFIMDLDGAEFPVENNLPMGRGFAGFATPQAVLRSSMQLFRHYLLEVPDGKPQLWRRTIAKLLERFFGPRILRYPNFSLIALFEKQKPVQDVAAPLQSIYADESVLSDQDQTTQAPDPPV